MTTKTYKRDGQGLLRALYDEETNLAQAVERVRAAETEYDLAASRYMAVRDLVKNRLGESPYSPTVKQSYSSNSLPRLDEFRYMGMNPTDAAVEVLQESGAIHQSLDELIKRLEEGGLDTPGMARHVNAGLLNRAGVAKDKLGRYYYEAEVLKG